MKESECKRKLVFELSVEQTQRFHQWIEPITRAHVDSDCEPPGAEIRFLLCACGDSVIAECGGQSLDLGDVHVQLVDVS